MPKFEQMARCDRPRLGFHAEWGDGPGVACGPDCERDGAQAMMRRQRDGELNDEDRENAFQSG